ncbi:hypothetical protein A2U01_0079937, partial [Trifolium medium]|nr:hypothetical protein [Trifolium medium]
VFAFRGVVLGFGPTVLRWPSYGDYQITALWFCRLMRKTGDPALEDAEVLVRYSRLPSLCERKVELCR